MNYELGIIGTGKKKNAGFSVLEVILAVALFVIFASGVTGAVLQGFRTTRLSSEHVVGSHYATEGIEAARSIKNRAFSNLNVSSADRGVAGVSNVWTFLGDGTNNTMVHNSSDNYIRTVKVEDAQRDNSGNIVASGGVVDPNIKKISSTVTWNFSPGRPESIVLTSYLANWTSQFSALRGIIVYSDTGSTAPRFRNYDINTNTFGSEASTVTGSVGRAFMVKTSPTKQEAVAGYVNASGTLQVMCYNGTTWTNEWSVAVGGTGTTRRFDIAYETSSGDVIVFYSTNVATTNELAFRTKSGTTGCGTANWSSATNFNPLRTSGIVQWVKMAEDPRFASNLITAIWADANRDLSAAVWNGSSWVNEPSSLLENALEIASGAQDVDSFDVAYESLSGDVMVVWGSGGSASANGAYYAVCTGGTATCSWGSKTAITSMANDATNLDISANSQTNEIVFASIGNGGSDLQAAYWSGTAWSGQNDIDQTCALPLAGTRLVATGWLISGSTTRSIVVYNNSGTSREVHGFVGNGGVFTRQGGADPNPWFTPTPLFGSPQNWYVIKMDPFNKDQLMFSLSDVNSDLFAKRLVMTATPTFTWTNADGSAALETLLGQAIASPFSFAYWANP